MEGIKLTTAFRRYRPKRLLFELASRKSRTLGVDQKFLIFWRYIYICISVYIYIYIFTFVGTHETLVPTTLSLWQTPQTPWFSEHFSHGASNAASHTHTHIYIYVALINLKETEVSYTHSFSCLVSFLTSQHVATFLFGSSMAKTGCRCPLVPPSLFESSVVFGVLVRICSCLTVFGDFIS